MGGKVAKYTVGTGSFPDLVAVDQTEQKSHLPKSDSAVAGYCGPSTPESPSSTSSVRSSKKNKRTSSLYSVDSGVVFNEEPSLPLKRLSTGSKPKATKQKLQDGIPIKKKSSVKPLSAKTPSRKAIVGGLGTKGVRNSQGKVIKKSKDGVMKKSKNTKASKKGNTDDDWVSMHSSTTSRPGSSQSWAQLAQHAGPAKKKSKKTKKPLSATFGGLGKKGVRNSKGKIIGRSKDGVMKKSKSTKASKKGNTDNDWASMTSSRLSKSGPGSLRSSVRIARDGGRMNGSKRSSKDLATGRGDTGPLKPKKHRRQSTMKQQPNASDNDAATQATTNKRRLQALIDRFSKKTGTPRPASSPLWKSILPANFSGSRSLRPSTLRPSTSRPPMSRLPNLPRRGKGPSGLSSFWPRRNLQPLTTHRGGNLSTPARGAPTGIPNSSVPPLSGRGVRSFFPWNSRSTPAYGAASRGTSTKAIKPRTVGGMFGGRGGFGRGNNGSRTAKSSGDGPIDLESGRRGNKGTSLRDRLGGIFGGKGRKSGVGRGGDEKGMMSSRDDGDMGGGKRRCCCFGRKDGAAEGRGDEGPYEKSPKVAWYILLAGMITVCVALGITGFVQGGSWVSPIGFQVLFWSTVLLGALTAVWVVIKVKGANANKGLAIGSMILGVFVFVESLYPGIWMAITVVAYLPGMTAALALLPVFCLMFIWLTFAVQKAL